MKRERLLELKERLFVETLVFENLGDPAGERIFRHRDLRRWGFDLLSGRRRGRPDRFLAPAAEGRRPGEVYERDAERFEVEEVLEELPPDTRLVGRILMRDGRAWLRLTLEGAEEAALGELPAGELLLGYLRASRHHRLLASLHDLGRLAELTRSRGQEGRAQPFDQLPGNFRQFLRQAREIGRVLGAGRVALAYFGRNKDDEPRYRLSWLVPTLALFDTDTAEKIDRLLDSLTR